MPHDPTFDALAMYGSSAWVAQRLGLTKDTFYRKRPALEAEGFPSRDKITGLYHKADVDAWIHRQRRIADRDTVQASAGKTEINYDAL